MSRLRLSVVAAFAMAVLAIYVTAAPGGTPSLGQFDPARLADLETRMWKAYYAKENVRLFGLLTTMLREQYHYSWVTATREAFHLARAASTFGNLKSGYEQVLPDLEAGYTTAKASIGGRFDPDAVARAELAWWVARRIPGKNSPDQVGDLIADEYAMLYDRPRKAVLRSAQLRAQAAALRDAEAGAPDWNEIGRLLAGSYEALRAAVGS
jgi:hypothetical protein